MNCVISIAAWFQSTRACLLSTGLAVVLPTTGCGAQDADTVKTASAAPHAASPLAAVHDATTDTVESAPPADDDSQWVPMTGSETVIVDDVGLLTDGAPVRAISSGTAAADGTVIDDPVINDLAPRSGAPSLQPNERK